MSDKPSILVVDDDESIRWILGELLGDCGYQVIQASSAEDAVSLLNSSHFDCLISDVRMAGQSGIDLLNYSKLNFPDLPVIIMTAHADLESAVQAYQQGAFEYLPKPFDLDEVAGTVERSLLKQPTSSSSPQPKPDNRFSIIGESPAMQDLYRAIGRLSQSQVSVLIHGESGSGKELIASALHWHSPRKNMPFIALNMAAIPKDLVESELFGHEKGAFTGAASRYLGRFEQADHGTLFLDEIGDMPLDAQTRLLRVLSEGAFYRIGSSQPTRVNVRIIAATHQNLRQKVEKGEFREDLYHRLNVIPLQVPPLRERKNDIPLLADFFFGKIAVELGEPAKQLQPDAIRILQNHPWPGNVRQLENTCRWLSVMGSGPRIYAKDLPAEINPPRGASGVSSDVAEHDWQSLLRQNLLATFRASNRYGFIQAQRDFEKVLITSALESTQGKKMEAAELLGWGRNTLTRKLNAFH